MLVENIIYVRNCFAWTIHKKENPVNKPPENFKYLNNNSTRKAIKQVWRGFFYLNKIPKQTLGSCHFDLETKDGVKDKDICHRMQDLRSIHTLLLQERT